MTPFLPAGVDIDMAPALVNSFQVKDAQVTRNSPDGRLSCCAALWPDDEGERLKHLGVYPSDQSACSRCVISESGEVIQPGIEVT